MNSFNDKNLPIKYEKVNIKRAFNKFTNLITFFPYHPTKSNVNNIKWIFGRGEKIQKPFCGIIDICHREGFVMFSDWFQILGSHKRFNKKEIIDFRQEISNYLLEIISKLSYKKDKERIILDNNYEYLNCWLNEMHKKICCMDHLNGWSSEILRQFKLREILDEAYRRYAEKRMKSWEKSVEKYRNLQKEGNYLKYNRKKRRINNKIIFGPPSIRLPLTDAFVDSFAFYPYFGEHNILTT